MAVDQSLNQQAESVHPDVSPPSDDEIVIAVMGATGSGKTTFVNLVSHSSLRVGNDLRSCTGKVQRGNPFELDGRKVVLIDTPGFDDTTRSDTEVLRCIAGFLEITYKKGKKLTGIIYTHRISDFRMGGVSTRNFRMFRQLCGESTLRNVVIVTNMWGEVSLEIGEQREAQLVNDDTFFKPVLDNGAKCLRHDNTIESAHNILRYIIGNPPLALQIQKEIVDQGKDISETAAGEELNRELTEQIKRYQQEIKALRKEMEEAIRAKDQELKRELQAETTKMQKKIESLRNDSDKLVADYKGQQAIWEQRLKEEEEKRELARVEYEEKISGIQLQLDGFEGSKEGRSDLKDQLDALQNAYDALTKKPKSFFTMVGEAIDSFFGL